MSLHDELVTEAERIPKSKIEDFMATLSADDLAEAKAWIREGGSKTALFRTLKRRGDVVNAVRPRLIIHGHYHLRYGAFHELPGGDRTLVQGLDCDGTPASRSTLFINKP